MDDLCRCLPTEVVFFFFLKLGEDRIEVENV